MVLPALEAEARVIVRVPDHDNEREIGRGGAAKPLADEDGTDALALSVWKDAHRRKRQHRHARVEPRCAEEDVADHVVVADRDEASRGTWSPAARSASTRSASSACPKASS
jgi:hypothetical protein